MAKPMSALDGSCAAPDWEIRVGSLGIFVQLRLNLRGTQSRINYAISLQRRKRESCCDVSSGFHNVILESVYPRQI